VKIIITFSILWVGDLALLILPCESACTVGAKANVPNVGWQNFKFFCAVGKKLKHEAVGCRVGKKSARWSVFSPVFLMSFGQLYGCRVGLYACW
jgi:hypothetical protein